MKLEPARITVFQEATVPTDARLAGWALLAHAFDVRGPVRRPSCVSEQHIRGSQREEGRWKLFDRRYWPGDTFGDQLGFALRHEAIDLLILKQVFEKVPRGEMEGVVR